MRSHPPHSFPSRPIEIIARAVLRRGPRILVCRNIAGGYVYLPGGHVEFGEPAAAALARELTEECGLAVRVGGLALVTEGVFTTGKKTHHEINLVFHVEHDASDPLRSREPDLSFEWVNLAALPDIDLRPMAIKTWLAAGDSSGSAGWVSEIPGPHRPGSRP